MNLEGVISQWQLFMMNRTTARNCALFNGLPAFIISTPRTGIVLVAPTKISREKAHSKNRTDSLIRLRKISVPAILIITLLHLVIAVDNAYSKRSFLVFIFILGRQNLSRICHLAHSICSHNIMLFYIHPIVQCQPSVAQWKSV